MKENPKLIRARKEGKAPLEYLVKSVWEEDARVHKHGADKYGQNNWRIDKILASTYEAAILRHYKAYFEDGEDIDPDSGEPHLAHIRTCCAVMRDAEMNGTLIDDRRKEVSYDRQEHDSGELEGSRNFNGPGQYDIRSEYERLQRTASGTREPREVHGGPGFWEASYSPDAGAGR